MKDIPAGPLAVLQRMRGNRPMPSMDERCEMCGEPIAEEHSHVVNVSTRSLMCACRGCYLLFTAQNAALAYRAVPERYLSFPSLEIGPAQWDELQIPVGVAFFFFNSQLGRTTAFYPSPAGATESELPLGAWEELVAGNDELTALLPDVEALLVRRHDPTLAASRSSLAPGASGEGGDDFVECYLVPIDACYQLVGTLRTLWRGFDGGRDAQEALDTFFDDVRARSRPAKPDSSVPANTNFSKPRPS
jgi:hypothetical protein